MFYKNLQKLLTTILISFFFIIVIFFFYVILNFSFTYYNIIMLLLLKYEYILYRLIRFSKCLLLVLFFLVSYKIFLSSDIVNKDWNTFLIKYLKYSLVWSFCLWFGWEFIIAIIQILYFRVYDYNIGIQIQTQTICGHVVIIDFIETINLLALLVLQIFYSWIQPIYIFFVISFNESFLFELYFSICNIFLNLKEWILFVSWSIYYFYFIVIVVLCIIIEDTFCLVWFFKGSLELQFVPSTALYSFFFWVWCLYSILYSILLYYSFIFRKFYLFFFSFYLIILKSMKSLLIYIFYLIYFY